MAIPRVFVSSTCYDLKYIRENLKFFIRNVGYEPILSEDGDVFYSPQQHTHESCLSEVSECQILVLVIGGRRGGTYLNSDKSITNMEYEAAIKSGIPVFALVEGSVYAEHYVYSANAKKGNAKIKAEDITYPSVDDVRIFAFIDEVRKCVANNAVYPFSDFSDIESYLRKQWAGMMYSYITSETEAKRVNKLFETIQEATQKIEFFTRQMAGNIGDDGTKLTIELYDMMFAYSSVRDLTMWRIKLSPRIILQSETLDILCEGNICLDEDDDGDGSSIIMGGPPYRLSARRRREMIADYARLRKDLLRKLQERGLSVDQYLALSEPK